MGYGAREDEGGRVVVYGVCCVVIGVDVDFVFREVA